MAKKNNRTGKIHGRSVHKGHAIEADLCLALRKQKLREGRDFSIKTHVGGSHPKKVVVTFSDRNHPSIYREHVKARADVHSFEFEVRAAA